MPIKNLDDITAKEIIPGFFGKFVHAEKSTLAYWEIKAGSELPEHAHFHEQTSQVTEGTFEMTIDGQKHILKPGAVAVIPSNVRHSGKALTDCKITDTFCPQRPEYS